VAPVSESKPVEARGVGMTPEPSLQGSGETGAGGERISVGEYLLHYLPDERIIVLNAFPISALMKHVHQATWYIERIPFEEFMRRLEEARREGVEVVSYVRHPATAKLLGLQPSSGNYEYKRGDTIYIVVLATPQRGVEVTEVKPEDLEVFMILEVED